MTMILFFPIENLVVYFAFEYSSFHISFLYFGAKIRKISENERDK